MFQPAIYANAVPMWIKEYMDQNGPKAPIVIGISGGKDSSITAAACVKAVGKERVIGVLMPNGVQKDINTAEKLCRHLGIKWFIYNIGPVIKAQQDVFATLKFKDFKAPNDTVKFNNPARIRMATLYYIANQLGGRVANTCNMSETYVGYDTAWGDQAGDFSPFQYFTASEVKLIGKELGLPDEFINVAPSDGMCGQTDEERWGFSYDLLDNYLRGGTVYETTTKQIEKMHKAAMYKNVRVLLPHFVYEPTGSRKLLQ